MARELYDQLTQRISSHFLKLKANNAFYQRIFSGQLTVDEVVLFIKNVSYLTAFTPVHLNMAQEAAEKRNLKNLAAYFKSKKKEEQGHDKWGEDDIRGIAASFPVSIQNLPVLSEMKAYVAANEELIRKDPYLYFVYILFAEYYTVIAGPESLAAIEKHCKIPQDLMSIISNHAELDKYHIEEWAAEASEVGIDPRRSRDYLEALDQIMKRYDSFCQALSKNHAKAA